MPYSANCGLLQKQSIDLKAYAHCTNSAFRQSDREMEVQKVGETLKPASVYSTSSTKERLPILLQLFSSKQSKSKKQSLCIGLNDPEMHQCF